jgi:hypothetical protein
VRSPGPLVSIPAAYLRSNACSLQVNRYGSFAADDVMKSDISILFKTIPVLMRTQNANQKSQ